MTRTHRISKDNRNPSPWRSAWLFLGVMVILAHGLPAGTERIPELATLMSRAQENGALRVFVGFRVDEYHLLIQRANSVRTASGIAGAQQEALSADQQLAAAIDSAGSGVLAEMNRNDYRLLEIYTTIPFMLVEATPEALIRLAELPQVTYIAEDQLRSPAPDSQPAGEMRDDGRKPPALSDSTVLIGADQAWRAGFDGTGWYVAVLDTGIRSSHQMFGGKAIVEQCYSANAHCPNGQKSMSGAGAAAHYGPGYTGWDHGTHVSGIAAGNSHLNAYGVARGAGIIAVQVFSKFTAAECQQSTPCVLSWDSDQVKGLEFVYARRAELPIASVNMSLGGGQYSNFCNSEPQRAAIANLYAVGIATAIASGNDGYCGYISAPACIGNAIAVGATNKFDQEASFSNWHPNLVELFAPGASILSSTGTSDASYSSWNGTSMATPHVAGAFAVLRQLAPSAPLDELYNNLVLTGHSVASRCGTGAKPRIAVFAALERMSAIKPPLQFTGQQHANRSALQVEYLNLLTWQPNPLNQNIAAYRIFQVNDGQLQLLGEVDTSTTSFMHRFIASRTIYSYAIRAVNSSGVEGLAASVSITPIQ